MKKYTSFLFITLFLVVSGYGDDKETAPGEPKPDGVENTQPQPPASDPEAEKRFQNLYDQFSKDLAEVDRQLLAFYKEFKGGVELKRNALAPVHDFKGMRIYFDEELKSRLEADQALHLAKRFRETQKLCITFERIIEESSRKKIDGRLVLAEGQLSKALAAGSSSHAVAALAKLSETIKELVPLLGQRDDAFAPSFVQRRRISQLIISLIDNQGNVLAQLAGRSLPFDGEESSLPELPSLPSDPPVVNLPPLPDELLVDYTDQILSKIGRAPLPDANETKPEAIKYSDMESYFAGLEKDSKDFAGAALKAARDVIANRNLLANDLNQLQPKLLFRGPDEVWSKIKSGQLGLLPEDSQNEYQALSSLVSDLGIRDVWNYKLNMCTPVRSEINAAGKIQYETRRKLLVFPFRSFGQIQQEKIEERFDATGQPVENPSATLIQQGVFLIQGRKEGRLFESIHWGGGIKGSMLEDPELSAESKFVQQQIERRMTAETRRVLTPLMACLDALLADQRLSPLFKAYLHNEICKIIFLRGDEWGVGMSSRIKQDHEHLKAIMNIPLKATDWMTPSFFKAIEDMQGRLALFYKKLEARSYLDEAKFNLGFLRELAKASFHFAGYVDERGQPRYLHADNPPVFTWCMVRSVGQISLQGFTGSNALPFSPLLAINKDWKEVYRQALDAAGSLHIDNFGNIRELIPFLYSTK